MKIFVLMLRIFSVYLVSLTPYIACVLEKN